MNELHAIYIALSQIKKLTVDHIRTILRHKKTLQNVDKLFLDDFLKMGLPLPVASSFSDLDYKYAKSELKKLSAIGGTIIPYESITYPKILKETYDPPLYLYAIGNTDCLNNVCISIVGARKVSKYGSDMATMLGGNLARCGITVVSGFAYGVDINAHIAAVKANGCTVAVLGSGLNNIYPQQHKKYITEICKKGCIITEFPMDEAPNNYNFPKRNRMVSGISNGTVVVEASERSGSLITARFALEQGRDVFAVPTTPLAANNATNKLIQNGAIMTLSHLDILAEYHYILKDILDAQDQKDEPEDNASDEEKIILNCIQLDPAGIDEITLKTKLPYDIVAANLMTMELEDRIEKKDDSRYYVIRK